MKHFASHPAQALKGILLLEGPKIFSATEEWQPVPKGFACPPGLEYKMDLTTGETLARLCEEKETSLISGQEGRFLTQNYYASHVLNVGQFGIGKS